MPADPLHHARELAAVGRSRDAIDVAWRAAMPAVVRHDDAHLRETVAFAQSVADTSTGAAREDALSLVVYCTECLGAPREGLFEKWSLTSLFARKPPRATKQCPDCAETIAAEAKVCRFCGYRYPDVG